MKATLFVVLAVAAGFVFAGCGSGSKTAQTHFAGPTTTTVSNVATGDEVRCTMRGVSVGAVVPEPGGGVTATADGLSGGATIQLRRGQDGSLTVSCR